MTISIISILLAKRPLWVPELRQYSFAEIGLTCLILQKLK
ncbi:hypothetical protein HMPREF0880_04150 [Yokenella regensburgei ATCC 43003]|nr:hypothetical protein HMPREF0880_04150 [Yokenella regensburgei ATCC 43003]